MAKPYQGPVHVRVALWDTITGMIREQQHIIKKAPKPDPGTMEELLMHETFGSIKGLRSVLHTLRDDIAEDLNGQLEELYL